MPALFINLPGITPTQQVDGLPHWSFSGLETLCKVCSIGWPTEVHDTLKPVFLEELSVGSV